jgi:F-type H+-transporting ATPase subunit b
MRDAWNSLLVFAQEHTGEAGGGEHADEPSGLDLILPAKEELLWGAIAFLAVYFILSKFAFPALRKSVEAREQEIQNRLESAETAKQEAHQEKEQYEKQIADAKGEANRIIEEGRQSAEQVRKDLIAKAEKEAEQIVTRAKEQLQTEQQRARQELQTEMAALSIELAERVVGKSLDGPTQRELVDAYIRDVGDMSSNGGSRN